MSLYENTPMQYTVVKNEKLRLNSFSYFCSKHRGGSNENPQSMFWSKNLKKKGIPQHTSVLLYENGI